MRLRGRAARSRRIAVLLAGATVACTKSGGQPADDGLDKALRRTEPAPWRWSAASSR